jgi:hypothetical protein
VRVRGSQVVDSREEYLGHADVKHGIVKRRNEPIEPPERRKEYEDRLRALVAAAKYVEDPSPQSWAWTPPSDSSRST